MTRPPKARSRRLSTSCRAASALFLLAFGITVTRLGLLPRWVGRSAFVLAAINLAFVPAVDFGDDAADFYSAQGRGTTAGMGALWSIWTLAVSISFIRSARSTETVSPGATGRTGRVAAWTG